ncbi:hypothetical protein PDIDSM_281 [Penicillium digitatum]|nr:hypothetical protein PDIDSM_281 [Penicillium digitatum]
MSEPAPQPPFLPSDLEQFAEHARDHPDQWFEYCRRAYDYIESTQSEATNARERVDQAELQLQAARIKITRLSSELTAAERDHLRDVAVLEYQKKLYDEAQQNIARIEAARMCAAELAIPTGNTVPPPVPEPAAEPGVAAAMGTPPSLTPNLPAPTGPEGPPILSQIKEKLNINRDRFPTPQSRMTYVTNRLKGIPYAQILPYIRDGICQLNDFTDILDILERAFGDPNRARNARNELYRLRQGNKEFSLFFAEFQRLAMEGEMHNEALPTMLEQAINREMKGIPGPEQAATTPPVNLTLWNCPPPPTSRTASHRPITNKMPASAVARRSTSSETARKPISAASGSPNEYPPPFALSDQQPRGRLTVPARPATGVIRLSAAAMNGLSVEEETRRSDLMILPVTLNQEKKSSRAMLC